MKKFKKFLEIKCSEGGKVPTEINILNTGEWHSPTHGDFLVTPMVIDEMIENFNNDVRKGTPIDWEHNTIGGAAGWITKLFKKGVGELWASVDWTPKGKQTLSDREYKFFSPEFAFEYQDPENGDIINNVLIGGGLTNRPLMKGLEAIMANEDNKNIIYLAEGSKKMKLEDILKKDPEKLSDKEKKFLQDNVAKVSDKDVKKFGLKTKKANEDEEKEEPKKEEPKKETKTEEPKKANENVTIKASELNELKKLAESGAKAFAEIREIKASEKVSGWLFNDKGEGKLPTTLKDDVVKFYMKLTEKQQSDFEAIIDKMPEAKFFKEVGAKTNADKDVKSASDLMTKKANELMEENKNLNFSDAILKVASDNPELYKKYINETEK